MTGSMCRSLRPEHGRGFKEREATGHWWALGPFVVEFHPGWFRLGASVSPWYVALFLGWVVVSFGKRKWHRPGRYAVSAVRWEASDG